MLKKLKSSLDDYAKNIVLVFTGTTVMNFFNLFFQLLIAHKLTAADFAAFNSLLALFAIFSSPLVTLQLAVTKYSCDFHAQNQISKLKFFLSDLLKKSLLLAGATFFLFLSLSNYLVNALKIPSLFCAYIVSALIALSWIVPVLAGGIQGLELFHWYSCSTVVSGILKLILGFIFIAFGYNIAGALGALLIATVVGLFIFYYPLRQFIVLGLKKEDINYKEILRYIFPVGATSLCFMALVSFDMVLVKSYFSPQDAGFYSLAQMLGKIFLFLPLAVSIVMFPRISSLNAKNMQTFPTLSRSLRYILILCFSTFIIYNLFPVFILKILTGKTYPEVVILGRLFSFSMTFFALINALIAYFLSIKDTRFLKYLFLFTVFQFIAIGLFHRNIFQVQIILCINALILFLINLTLAIKNKNPLSGG